MINLSVWEDLDALKAFVYRSHHVDFVRQREDWFERLESYHLTLW
jgi:Domain of unknown function (DUF3291)